VSLVWYVKTGDSELLTSIVVGSSGSTCCSA
jgi:hypothetical protein